MVKRQTARIIRKSHRYLGLFLGIQFLIWTVSGIYFSWTNIDEIHGDHYIKTDIPKAVFGGLLAPTAGEGLQIQSLSLRDIGGEPYYWINNSTMLHARTGEVKNEISREDALAVAQKYVIAGLRVQSVDRITEMDPHHEYRGKPMPAWVISYEHPEAVKAYVSARDGGFQMIRHRDWRWFDFLWMTHTMDYEGRDNINTMVLRIFSLLGLITVLSGFTLWISSSPTLRKKLKKKKSTLLTRKIG